jgi:superfamily II DNA/RNA helicase
MGSTPETTSTHDFADLGVPARLVDVLAQQGISSAFPIQVATLPDSLAGRDVLGRGRTGSGKTLAFALPLVVRTAATRTRPVAKRPRALVLLPTRELATQVQAAMAPLADAMGLSTMTIFGGVGQRPQVTALSRGVDIVIACPGRLEDLMRQGHVRLDDVAITVIDEADHMADLGFLPGVRRILDATDRDGQRLLFSATLDNGVDVLVRRYLTNPVHHSVDDDASTEPDIDHHVLTVAPADKAGVVTELASGLGRSVLFTRTKHSAKKLARDLTQSGVPAVDLHGNLSQAARDRNLGKFRSGEVRVLVATDVAARGIHVDDVALVVHVDPPTEHKAYTHRSGRTARAGASGVVVTVQTRAQRSEVAAMTRRAGITPALTTVSPGAEEILALTGPRAAHVTPAPVAAQPVQQPGRRPRGNGQQSRGAGQQQSRPRRRDDGRGSSGAPKPRSSSSRQGSPTSGRTMSVSEFSSGGRRSR